VNKDRLIKANITFIGGGNMAGALIQGLIANGVPGKQLRVAEPNADRRWVLEDQYGIQTFANNRAAIAGIGSGAVVLAVKPGVVKAVLSEIAIGMDSGLLVVSIAAGVPMARLAAVLPQGQPLVRVMPNTPALVRAGISAMLFSDGLSEIKRELARRIMEAVGEVLEVTDEALMEAVTALSGSGPAYVYLMAEALSDGGVACGLPREFADRLAVKTLLGSARMIDESGQHPAVLKNQVTSPGGTTIAGVAQLETSGVRGALIAAVRAAWKRSCEMSGQ